jgi:hypothetical protein
MTTTPATPPQPVPDGFFDEVAAHLQTETAEEISEVVIATCISRGILHTDLEEDPDDELRAVQMGEVFALVAAVSCAVADGTIVPRGVRFIDTLDPGMAQAWEDFTDAAADPQADAAAAAMLESGTADSGQAIRYPSAASAAASSTPAVLPRQR